MSHSRCMIVKTEGYSEDEIAKVVQLRANVEGLKLGEGVLDRLAKEGEKSSLRCAFLETACPVPDSVLSQDMHCKCSPRPIFLLPLRDEVRFYPAISTRWEICFWMPKRAPRGSARSLNTELSLLNRTSVQSRYSGMRIALEAWSDLWDL